MQHALNPFFKTSTTDVLLVFCSFDARMAGATSMGESAKKILQTQFWISAHIFVDIFLSNWLRLFTTPWPKCTLRQRMRRMPPVRCIRTRTFIKFCTWLCSIFRIAFLRFRLVYCLLLSEFALGFFPCSCVSSAIIPFRCCCSCYCSSFFLCVDSIESFFLQQFYRCDVILNQISMKKIPLRYASVCYPVPASSCPQTHIHTSSIVSTVFVITIFHRFYFNATWT